MNENSTFRRLTTVDKRMSISGYAVQDYAGTKTALFEQILSHSHKD